MKIPNLNAKYLATCKRLCAYAHTHLCSITDSFYRLSLCVCVCPLCVISDHHHNASQQTCATDLGPCGFSLPSQLCARAQVPRGLDLQVPSLMKVVALLHVVCYCC